MMAGKKAHHAESASKSPKTKRKGKKCTAISGGVKAAKHRGLVAVRMLNALSKPKDRKVGIQLLADYGIDCVCEGLYNVLYCKRRMSLKNKEKLRALLKRHKKSFDTLTDKSVGVPAKRKLLKQRGGMLGTILGVALPLLSSLISGAIG